MKKRIMVFMLALVMLMLAACGSRTPAAPSIIDTQPETQPVTQPTQETQPPQTQPTVAPTQPTVPAAPLEYTGIYWRTWNEQIGGTSAVRNAYYVLNADHTGYVVAQEVGKITWNERQVTDNLGLSYSIALTQDNGIVNLMVYEFQNNPTAYQKIAKLPAEVEAEIAAYNTPAPTVPTTPKVYAPEITKNPTSETVTEGGNAYFVARANNYTTINWYIISADRTTRMPVNNAPWYFSGLTYSGEGTTTLLLSNIPLALNGWCVEAVFNGEGGSATTIPCYINVNKHVSTPIYAVPSGGFFFADQSVQLTAAPGDSIYYELIDEAGIAHTGTIKSGDYIYIPVVTNRAYVARLVAYVVGDQNNLTVCEYNMDGTSSSLPPQPAPTPAPGFDGGGYTNNEVTVTLTPTGNNHFIANLNILRLCDMDGSGDYTDGIVTMSLTDPSGNLMGATFNVSNATVTITYSTWELLPQGTVFYGVY